MCLPKGEDTADCLSVDYVTLYVFLVPADPM